MTSLLLALFTLCLSLAASAGDLLDTPAAPSPLAARALINGLAQAGSRIVAVGQRGHILYSDNQGQQWTQAAVPASSDLVAVHFPTPQLGWAVGHDGVILHSADAGATWTRQLDARKLAAEVRDPSFLDVWFSDAQHGYAIGAFNLVYVTGDAGAHWVSWSANLDNPKGFHLNAIRPVGKDLFIVGEQGLVLRLAAGGERFAALATPYKGSFFGVTGKDGVVIAHGLRGNAWRSTDGGATWNKVDTGVAAGITASAVTADGALVLVSQAGQVLVSHDDGAHFTALPVKPGPASVALATGNQIIIGGVRGLRVLPIK